MSAICLSINCRRENSIIKSSSPHTLEKVEIGATSIWHHLVDTNVQGSGRAPTLRMLTMTLNKNDVDDEEEEASGYILCW